MNYNNEPQNTVPNENNGNMNPMMGMNQNPGNLNSSIPEIKRRRNMLPVIIVAIFLVLAVGGAITFKVIVSSPKRVFETTIKNFYKNVSSSLDNVNRISENFDFENKALTFSGDAKLDTNLADAAEIGFNLKDLQVGGSIGLDINNEQATASAFVKGPKETVEGNGYYTDKKVYVDTNLYDKLIYAEGEDVDIDFAALNELVKELQNHMIEVEEVDYVVAAVTNAIADSLDTTYMSKKEEKIKITKDDKTFTKYSYTLSDNAIRDLVNGTIDKLSKDSKFIQILSKLSGIDEDTVKSNMDAIKESTDQIEFEDKIVLNIYTYGFLNKFAGLSLEVENEEIITYVDDTKDFKITATDEDNKLEIVGKRSDSKTEIEVEYDDTKVLTLTVKEFTKEKIDISFETDIAKEMNIPTIGGSIYFTYNEEKTKISGEYKLQIDVGDYYANVSGNYKFISADSLDMPNVKDAININEVDPTTITDNLEEKISKDEVLSSIFNETISEIEQAQLPQNQLPLDNFDMHVIPSTDDLKKVLNKKGASVIYVGDIYSTADGTPAATLFQDLVSVQKTYGFNSYRLDTFFYDDSVKELFGNVITRCDTAPCEDMPIIFFIKDGEVVDFLMPISSKESIIGALQIIGIQTNDKI